ncbi:MAG: sugar kinase [Deltaproteobacteria bacterium]|nr:sugar kinase [Deltaproteobacteria bacterium]
MLALVGTIPQEDFPLTFGQVSLRGESIFIGGRQIPVNRGTAALIAAAIKAGQVIGLDRPTGFLAGDIGLGQGSRRLYEHLAENLSRLSFQVLTFHYILPDVDWHNKVLFAAQAMERRPVLIADAGFMYAAKMSGLASSYDLFTPDAGEMAFLADEEAPHPFYTRGFILHEEERVPELIARAYTHDNAAQVLLVKSRRDYLATAEGVQATIDEPVCEALEAIGGTGDTLTGIASALAASGMETPRAALLAARANRLAGLLADPSPATQVSEIIRRIPFALEEVLREDERSPG